MAALSFILMIITQLVDMQVLSKKPEASHKYSVLGLRPSCGMHEEHSIVVSITEIIEYYKKGYLSVTVGTRLHLASG